MASPTIWGLLLPLLSQYWRTTLAICFLMYKRDISCSFGCSEKFESSWSTNWHHLNTCRALKPYPWFHNLWTLSQLWLQWTTICFCGRMPCKQWHNSGSTEDRNGRRDPGLNEERTVNKINRLAFWLVITPFPSFSFPWNDYRSFTFQDNSYVWQDFTRGNFPADLKNKIKSFLSY